MSESKDESPQGASPAEPSGAAATGAPEAPLAPDQVAELKMQAGKAAEYWDRLLRTAADLENTRKRAARERQEAVRFANEALLGKLVAVLDHFDMAVAAASNPQAATVESLKTGFAMINSQLKGVLREAGLEEIDATGQVFDPKWHEAVSQQETAAVPEGHVVQQLRKGYKLRERLLRPAGVVVARKPAA
ncbi:MAG: nucleotide exchange factor GrpE [Verrucomicrobia bacterium]|nr:nucleotide exchange factor GrpE [Verrucomicrobiota bacterium]